LEWLYEYMYIYVYIYIYIYVHIYTYLCVCLYLYAVTFINMNINTCIYIHTHIHIHICIHTYIYTYMYIHIQTFEYVRIRFFPGCLHNNIVIYLLLTHVTILTELCTQDNFFTKIQCMTKLDKKLSICLFYTHTLTVTYIFKCTQTCIYVHIHIWQRQCG